MSAHVQAGHTDDSPAASYTKAQLSGDDCSRCGEQLDYRMPVDADGTHGGDRLFAHRRCVRDADRPVFYTRAQLDGEACALCGQPLAEGQPTEAQGTYDGEVLYAHLSCIETAESEAAR